MKQFVKKKMSFVMAMFMAMVTAISVLLPMTAFAKENYTLTLNNDGQTNHTFEIYQIFTGDLSGNVLSNIEWGSGIKEDSKAALGDASEKAKTLVSVIEAEKFANEIQKDLSTTKRTQEVSANSTARIENLDAGYYLIKDSASTQSGIENGAYTVYILKIVGNTEAKTKLDVPTVTKKVQENSDMNWQDAADYNIGDTIPYKLTGTLPTNYDKYEKYTYKFHDEMSSGLTFNQNSVKVTVDDVQLDKSAYQVNFDADRNSFTITFDDLKQIQNPVITANSKIVVEYTCELNGNAVIGANGNPNTVYLEYSNNPNKDGDGEYGTTPKDKNIVFTYKVVVNKKNENAQALKGAEFELYKKTDNGEEKIDRFTIQDIMDSNKSTFTFKGLDAGTYVLKESKTPDGYNTIKPVEFTITAEYDKTADDPRLNSLKATTTNLGVLNFTVNKEEGSLSADVINNKGFTLPETGGMGRYLIYTLGAIFVLAALGYVGYKKSRKHDVQ